MDGNFNNRSNQGNRGFGERRHNVLPPVRVGEEIDVTIEAVGEKGDGICKKKGFILFVPETVEGDRVRIKITKILHKVGFARVIGPALTQEEEAPQKRKQPKPEYVTEQQVKPQPSVPAPEDSDDFGDDDSHEDETDSEEKLTLAQEVGEEVSQGIKEHSEEEQKPAPETSEVKTEEPQEEPQEESQDDDGDEVVDETDDVPPEIDTIPEAGDEKK